MIQIKDGVSIKIFRSDMLKMLLIVDEVWAEHAKGIYPVITSYFRSQAMLHSFDKAIDLRTKNLTDEQKDKVYTALREALFADGYDVILEYRGQAEEHIHIEYDPKPGRGIA